MMILEDDSAALIYIEKFLISRIEDLNRTIEYSKNFGDVFTPTITYMEVELRTASRAHGLLSQLKQEILNG